LSLRSAPGAISAISTGRGLGACVGAAGCGEAIFGACLRPMRTALPMSFLPPDVLALFERAFVGGLRDPGVRPAGAEWRAVLTRMIGTL
jgi:hypothetical protein